VPDPRFVVARLELPVSTALARFMGETMFPPWAPFFAAGEQGPRYRPASMTTHPIAGTQRNAVLEAIPEQRSAES
jgi:hypothetical protein